MPQNNVVLNFNEEDLDMAMSDANTVIGSNASLREMVRETGSRGIITIPDFLTSRYVTRNQLGQNYCSSLTILLPGHEEVTPIDMIGFFPAPLDPETGKPMTNYNPGNNFYKYGELPVVDGRTGETVTVQPGTEYHIPPESYYTVPADTTVVVVEEDDEEGETSNWKKIKAWSASTATTIWSGTKKATVWTWDNVLVPTGKVAIVAAANYYLGPAAGYIAGGTVNYLTGKQAPNLIGIDKVPEDHLIEYHPENRDEMRDAPSEPIYMIDPTDYTVTYISKEYFKNMN